MSMAVDDLKSDHEAILHALDILDSISDKLGRGAEIPSSEPLALIDFLKEFADTCHHGKEEGIFFPALESAGIPRDGGPVGVMLHEHELGREYIRRMRAALGSVADHEMFVKNATAYTNLLRNHIEKENTVLFPMGERLLKAEQLASISEQFQRHENEVIGAGRHEELHAMLKDFGERYLK